MKKKISGVIWKEGKHYVAQGLNVDVSSFGNTKKEALRNLDEAVELYFEDTDSPSVIQVERPEVITLPFEYV